MLNKYFKHKNPETNISNHLCVARPGLPIILGLALAFLITWLFSWCVLEIIFLVLFVFCLIFFRDPQRPVPPPGFGLSPADGKIIRVDEGAVCPITGAKATKVSVFLNLFNVHVNRIPIDCRLDSQKYFPGTFVNASFDKASENNERYAAVLIDEKNRQVTMIQIAGFVARRILTWVAPGQYLQRGQRYGMIMFGSRVDLYLPPEAEIMVTLGQKVQGGWS
ncbi:MAG: phosphatidylserine decarboxylase family protein, partial [Deltaproteobacteria bacterium]|nr:phosphatidylserine decarboxylase family protein [Deltaproteobacteria bacterium]